MTGRDLVRRSGPVQLVRHMLLLGSFVVPVAAEAATLDIELTGVENDHGLVRVAVCTPDTFATKHCPFFGAAPARAGNVLIRMEGIPPGRYAAQAYHDEDGNGSVRHSLFGVPSKAIGFSRDVPLRLGPPRFEDAAIEITEPSTTTRLRLRHIGW